MQMTLELWMDVAVLLVLAVAIFYVLRLSQGLAHFRRTRAEFEGLIATLSENIAQAYGAIEALRGASETVGADLEGGLEEARTMLDELTQVNAASAGLAQRLVEAAYGARAEPRRVDTRSLDRQAEPRSVEGVEGGADTRGWAALDPSDVSEGAGGAWQSTLSVKMRDGKRNAQRPRGVQPVAARQAGAFSIRDPDFDNDSIGGDFDTQGDDGRSFSSQAERELYEALSRKRGR